MIKLKDNDYNKTLTRDKPKLKIWSSAGLMLTYKCPASCECCYYSCGPEKSGLMSVENAISAWQGLKRLAGPRAKIHITGGEPFLYPELLKEILFEASNLNLGPTDMVETNAFWAENQNQVNKMVEFLAAHNVNKLKISYDPFHAEFVSLEKVKLLYQVACKIMGPDRVLLRWLDYLANPPQIESLSEEQKWKLFAESSSQYKTRFNGRAAGKLAQLLADKEVNQLSQNCRKSFLDSKSVHIDPYGNVFNGVCSGIIIGNINDTSLDELWLKFNPTKKEFLNVLFKDGPAGFLEKATEQGYQKSRLYSGKCHLCTRLRQFFFDNNEFSKIINPKDCYS